MKNLFCFFLFLSITHHLYSQDTTSRSTRFWESQIGFKYYPNLEETNNLLTLNDYEKLQAFGMTGSIYRGVQLNKFTTSVHFQFNLMVNNRKANKIVVFNETALFLDFSYNLLKKAIRLEPVIGIGFGTATLKLMHEDTITSINTILNGSPNNYKTESKLNIMVKTGVKIGFTDIPFENTSIHPQIQIGYSTNLTNFKWKISDMPLRKTGGLYAQIGLVKFF